MRGDGGHLRDWMSAFGQMGKIHDNQNEVE